MIVVREEKVGKYCFRTRDQISHSYNITELSRLIIYHRAALPNCGIARYVGGLASSQFLRHSHPHSTRSSTQPIHVARSIHTGACDCIYDYSIFLASGKSLHRWQPTVTVIPTAAQEAIKYDKHKKYEKLTHYQHNPGRLVPSTSHFCFKIG